MLERMRESRGSQLRRFPERRNIEWLVECKEKGITQEDLSQFIWYILAYKVPSALIFQGSLDSLDQRDILENFCLLYTSPSPRDRTRSRMPSSA